MFCPTFINNKKSINKRLWEKSVKIYDRIEPNYEKNKYIYVCVCIMKYYTYTANLKHGHFYSRLFKGRFLHSLFVFIRYVN